MLDMFSLLTTAHYNTVSCIVAPITCQQLLWSLANSVIRQHDIIAVYYEDYGGLHYPIKILTIPLLCLESVSKVPYSRKFWWGKTLTNLAICYEFAKFLSANCL